MVLGPWDLMAQDIAASEMPHSGGLAMLCGVRLLRSRGDTLAYPISEGLRPTVIMQCDGFTIILLFPFFGNEGEKNAKEPAQGGH